jgi:predicted RNA-binding Zn-ribbon protein involved in translation (DUF1610 family)
MIESSARSRSERDLVHLQVRQKRRAFRCANCGSHRLATYEVRHYVGPRGERWIVRWRDGAPVPAPMFGDRCPTCGRISVTFDADRPEHPAEQRRDAAAG